MNKENKLNVSHAPFWHNGSSIPERNYNIFVAALPALFIGIVYYGIQALGVVSLSISSAIIWHLIFEKLTKQEITIGDGSSALIGLLIGMLLPASAPWWLVIVSTFIAVIIGVQIFGGIGGNPFNPIALSLAILIVSWGNYLDLNQALVNFKLSFPSSLDPLKSLKHFGPDSINDFKLIDLFIGNHVSAIGSGSTLAIILGGVYLLIRGIIRWEISLSYIVAILVTAFIFHTSDPSKYAEPLFHLLAGNTMLGIFFLATEDSSSPVNFIPMLLYGFTAGIMTVLIRNIGLYVDGVVFAILIANLINPVLDKIRPKAIGKVV